MKKILSIPRNIWGFFKEVYQELKLVEFPSRKETFKMTNIVIFMSLALGVLLLGLDTIFILLRNYITSLNS